MRSMLKNLFPIKKRPLINLTVFQQPLHFHHGGCYRDRTCDLLYVKQVLSQLS